MTSVEFETENFNFVAMVETDENGEFSYDEIYSVGINPKTHNKAYHNLAGMVFLHNFQQCHIKLLRKMLEKHGTIETFEHYYEE